MKMSEKCRRLSEIVGENVGDIQEIIIRQIKIQPSVSASAMAQKLSVTQRTVERYIKILREAGILIRHGSARGGYWEVVNHSNK